MSRIIFNGIIGAMKKWLILLLVCASFLHTAAASTPIDSLKKSLNMAGQPIDKMRTYCALSLQYLYKNVDSAQYFISKSLMLQAESSADSLSPYHLNIQGMVSYVSGDVYAANNWWTMALDSAKKYGTTRTEVQILNNLAIWHNRYGVIEDAVMLYRQALGVAHNLNNNEVQYNLLVTIGNTYLSQNLLDSALVYFVLAKEQDLEGGDRLNVSMATNNIGVVFTQMADYSSAIQYYKEAIESAVLFDDENVYQLAQYNMADLYMSLEKIDDALEILNELESLYEQSGSAKGQREVLIQKVRAKSIMEDYRGCLLLALDLLNNNQSLTLENEQIILDYALLSAIKEHEQVTVSDLLPRAIEAFRMNDQSIESTPLLSSIASAYLFLNVRDSAEQYLVRLESILSADSLHDNMGMSPLRKRNAYLSLFSYYESMSEVEGSVAQLLKNAYDLNNEYHSQQLDKVYQKNVIDYEVYRKDIEINLEREKSKTASLQLEVVKRTNTLIIVSVLFLLAVIAGLAFWRWKHAKRKRQLLSIELNAQRLLAENEQLKNEQLSNRLAIKNKESLNQAMQLIQKNNMLSEYRDVLNKISPDSFNMETISALKNSLERIHKLRDKEWDVFNKSFESVNQNFYNKILEDAPELTPRELQLCALIKMNLTVKELSQLLNITNDGVKKARHRIRKKFGIEDPKLSLTKRLMQY